MAAHLRQVAREHAPHVAPLVLRNAFHEVDRDGDGRVSYGDFVAMMRPS
jgi:hypothetical protein